MKKTKIERRLENAWNAFFADENPAENALSFAGETAFLKRETSGHFTGKLDVFVKVLKRVFLFFPGTFVLFNVSLFLAFLTLNPPDNTTTIYTFRAAAILLISAFMTMFGLGDARKIGHSIIPATIVLFAAASGVFFSFFIDAPRALDNYAMYLFPLALVIPILAKDWIDKSDDKNSAV